MERRKKPVVTITLIAINVIIFIFTDLIFYQENGTLVYYLANNPVFTMEEHEYWRFLTSMFFHFDIEHLMYNMLMLGYVGYILEYDYGKVRYLFLYFFTGIIADITSNLYNSLWTKELTVMSAGASGAIFGLEGALIANAVICGGQEGTSIKRRDVPILLVFTLAVGFFETGVDHAAHIGGFLAGTLLGGLFTFIKMLRRKNKKNPWNTDGFFGGDQ